MGRAKALCPSYSLHKSTNQARVRVEGRDIYLGPYNSPESRQRYAEILAQLTAGKAVSVPAVSRGAAAADPGVTVNELVAAFLQHADGHYVKDGKQTSEVHCLKSAVRPLVEMFGFTPADDFGPLKLSAVREQMVAAGWCRRGVNQGVKRIRIVFRWGVSREMVSPLALSRLESLQPLLRGRTTAPDNDPKQPATEEQIQAVLPFVSDLVADLIQVQRLTGARAGELLAMTPGRLDRSKAVWLFNVAGHKTAHHGHKRTVAIGPKAQRLLAGRLLGLADDDVVFPIRRDSYTLAVRRACLLHNRRNPGQKILPWTPHQLRHAKAAEVRERHGLEAVQSVLGHSTLAMSEHYAPAVLQRAVAAAAEAG